jgi:hypothetical protein
LLPSYWSDSHFYKAERLLFLLFRANPTVLTVCKVILEIQLWLQITSYYHLIIPFQCWKIFVCSNANYTQLDLSWNKHNEMSIILCPFSTFHCCPQTEHIQIFIARNIIHLRGNARVILKMNMYPKRIKAYYVGWGSVRKVCQGHPS